MTDKVPYELLGGEEGVRNLCNAMYDAIDTLPEAQIIRQMHEENLSEIRQKFFEYMSTWLGGPALYSEKHGSMCITDPHAPFAIGKKERDLWLLCMDTALDKVNASDEVREMIKKPLSNVADMLRNQED